jgi:hypothetical protein
LTLDQYGIAPTRTDPGILALVLEHTYTAINDTSRNAHRAARHACRVLTAFADVHRLMFDGLLQSLEKWGDLDATRVPKLPRI